MQNLIEQSEIDELCDELSVLFYSNLRNELMLYNNHGGGAQNEAAYAELKAKIDAAIKRADDLANRLLCPCRG